MPLKFSQCTAFGPLSYLMHRYRLIDLIDLNKYHILRESWFLFIAFTRCHESSWNRMKWRWPTSTGMPLTHYFSFNAIVFIKVPFRGLTVHRLYSKWLISVESEKQTARYRKSDVVFCTLLNRLVTKPNVKLQLNRAVFFIHVDRDYRANKHENSGTNLIHSEGAVSKLTSRMSVCLHK